MAYFRKRGDKWYYTIDIGRDPITGKRKQKVAVGGNTKKEAQAAAAAFLHELTKGTHIEETDMTFKDFAEVWLNEYTTSGHVKESTVRVRKHEIGLFSKYFKMIRMKDITKKMYQSAITDMKKSGLADNTISGAHGTGRMIFRRAVEYDMIKTDPTEFARLPRKQKTVEEIENNVEMPKYLEKEELALFLKTAQQQGLEGDYEGFLLLAYTGMRVGEFVVLREPDINFQECTVSITKTYYNPSNNAKEYKLLTPKTKKSIRTIEVEPIVIDAIRRYIVKHKEFKMLHRDTYYDKGYILPNTNKHPGYPNFIKTIENRMQRLLKLAGLNTSLTPHSLRHTHTSLLAEAGVPLEEIMDRLGHQDDKTTKLVYLHVTKTRKKEASKKFGELLKNL